MDREAPTQNAGAQPFSVALDSDLVIALDRFIAELHPGISRAEALALALRDWAGQHGYVGSRHPIRPEDLNASNDD
jgi:hypothetical protein